MLNPCVIFRENKAVGCCAMEFVFSFTLQQMLRSGGDQNSHPPAVHPQPPTMLSKPVLAMFAQQTAQGGSLNSISTPVHVIMV